ncbi:Tfp pilus assembly protein PilF [Desulfovibrio sp. X2]|uniref:Tfp pilus assembly protein PilF n=1 Tax=Desulfovibrio sp. X2 TaxID=941449 RepID=UPI001267871F|nr:Tfp pilus assembly protein PilF [Desulfovibrio sp. X2]
MKTENEERFAGAFSILQSSKVGAGTTAQKHVQTMNVYAEEKADGTFSLRYLNDNFVPVGKAWTVDKDTLLTEYTPEPDLYMNKVYPAMRELSKTIAHAERLRESNQTYSAEYEFKRALRIDETNIRATFGFGLVYLDRNDAEKAELVFRRLVTLEAAFDREHKHLFNEFGIKLRRAGLLDQALEFYGRAEEYSHNDENLHYNRARAFEAKGEVGEALSSLEKALAIRPDFHEARKFRDGLRKGPSAGRKAVSGGRNGME